MTLAHAWRALAGAIAAVVAATAFAQPPVVNRTTSSFVYGNGYTSSSVETSTQTFSELSANEIRDIKGGYQSTSLFVSETRYGVGIFGQRWLSCSIDAKDLQVNAQRAGLSASVDAGSPECATSGVLCGEAGCATWGFSGIVQVSGSWRDPQIETKSSGRVQTTNRLSGFSYSQNCHTTFGDIVEGGFAVGSNTYTFGLQAYGQFQFSSCNTVNK